MKARLSTTSLLFLFLSGLTAWYVVYEKQIRVKRVTDESSSKRLLQFKKDEIQEIEITHSSDSSFKLKRSGDEWLLTSPVEDLADSGVINSLLTTLTSSEQERIVEDDPKNLEVFGLEKPTLIIRVAKDANTTQEIFVGSQTQVGFSVYVRTSASQQVSKVNRSLLSSFQKSLFELRNKNLVTIKKSDLKEVEIHNSSGQIVVNRNAEDKWILGRDGSAVDTAEWGKTLNTLIDLKATNIASEKAELAAYRLDKPAVKTWLSAGHEKAKLGIFFSQTQGKVFAKRDDKPLIYEVDKNVLRELSKSAVTLKDLHLVNFNRFAVNRIKISRGNGFIELKKEGPVWTFTDVKSERKLDPGKVEKFLTQLQDSKITRFTDAKKDKNPALIIELFEKQEEKDVSVARVEFAPRKTEDVVGVSNHLIGSWVLSQEGFKQLNLVQEDFLETNSPKVDEKKS
ncbi:MAG: DUF4340 domain-containing protein [Proteobacteria bacterium]|nr:DUF4340 domain-containing protein [Pseudomonadota bacterium]